MATKKVLVPIDFSALSEAAIEYATPFVVDGGELYIAHVRETAGLYKEGNDEFYGTSDHVRDKLREMLAKRRPSDPNIKVYHRLLDGEPVEAILHFADAEHIDLIVTSTHGRTGLTQMIMGSVASKIMARAHCPVMLLKT